MQTNRSMYGMEIELKMDNLKDVLTSAVHSNASDVFIIAGAPLSYKTNGHILPQYAEKVLPDLSERLIRQIYEIAERPIDRLLELGDDDFAFSIPGLSRFRASTYKQRGSLAAVIRIITFGIPDYREFGIPDEVMRISEKTKGLVLVTGPAGGGKSTTLACVIDQINATREGHIITLEEPIEFLHRNKKSVVSQREVELDTRNYVTALRACLRQAPDVILLGEMRDLETIQTAMTAAETGHLVISTLHTVGAANTIDRIVDVFPPEQQQQIKIQLAMLLQTVVSQQLVPTVKGGLVPAFEIMHVTSAIRTMIREGKVHQIDTVIASSAPSGMVSMDASLLELCHKGVISEENAVRYAVNVELMGKRVKGAR